MLRHQLIEYNLEAHPIQIRTFSHILSNNIINLVVYRKNASTVDQLKEIGGIRIKFSHRLMYRVMHCSTRWQQFRNRPPRDRNKIWTITKTSTNLKIACNSIEALDLKFQKVSPSCASKWSQHVRKIVFWGEGLTPLKDTASVGYRRAPSCDLLTDNTVVYRGSNVSCSVRGLGYGRLSESSSAGEIRNFFPLFLSVFNS